MKMRVKKGLQNLLCKNEMRKIECFDIFIKEEFFGKVSDKAKFVDLLVKNEIR